MLGLLLIPATAARFGDRAVLVGGLAIMLAGLLVLRMFDEHTALTVVFAAVALNAVGGAIVATPQATIMIASAPAQLGGALSGVKCAVNQAGYSLCGFMCAAEMIVGSAPVTTRLRISRRKKFVIIC